MTDPPVTLCPPAKRSPPCQRHIALYIVVCAKPEIGRFAIALTGSKRLIALSA